MIRAGVQAIKGGVWALSQSPIGYDEDAVDRYAKQPFTFPIVGYLLGVALVPIFFLPVPEGSMAVLFVVWVTLFVGIFNGDGLGDLGDGATYHRGNASQRLEAMTESSIGVGGGVAIGLTVVCLGITGLQLAGLDPLAAAKIVVAAEVAAKLAMAFVACFGTATHEGIGSSHTRPNGPRDFAVPVLLALPAALLTYPSPAAGVALVAGLLGAVWVFRWSNAHIGGVNGDIIGSVNEIGRLAGLQAGIVVYLL